MSKFILPDDFGLVYAPRLTQTQLLVLLVLMEREVRGQDKQFIHNNEMADIIGKSSREVGACISDLSALGIVVESQRSRGQGHKYKVQLANLSLLQPRVPKTCVRAKPILDNYRSIPEQLTLGFGEIPLVKSTYAHLDAYKKLQQAQVGGKDLAGLLKRMKAENKKKPGITVGEVFGLPGWNTVQ
jgi:biotin operon repressor